MSNIYGPMVHLWPYVAAVVGVLVLGYILIYCFGITSGRRASAWKYSKEVDHCRKLMAEGRNDEAAAFVKPLLRKQDIPAEFFDIAAVVADKRGRPAEAGRYWRDMQRYYPTSAWGHMRTARFLLRQGKTKQAHRVLDRARATVLDPHVLDTVLAEAAQAAEQWDEAIRLWAELRETSPGEVRGYLQARICLAAVGRAEEGDALLEDVAARMPSNPYVKAAVAAAKRQTAATPPPPR